MHSEIDRKTGDLFLILHLICKNQNRKKRINKLIALVFLFFYDKIQCETTSFNEKKAKTKKNLF